MRTLLTLPFTLGLALVPAAAAQRIDDEPGAELGSAPTQSSRLPIELYLDFGVAISGNQIITLTDLRSKLSTRDYLQRAESGEDLHVLQDEALVDLIETLMQTQAGKDRGFDPLFVDAITDNRFEERIQELGGHREFSESLRDYGITPQEYKEQVKDSLYRRVWRESTTGRQRGPLGRFSVDRDIRPGLLKSTYDAYVHSRLDEERALVGAEPERFVLQAIVLDIGRHGGLDKCRALAHQLRDKALSEEEDFDVLVRGWGEFKDNDGVFEPVNSTTLLNLSRTWFGSNELASFALSAKPGDIAQPMVRRDPHGIFIYRLVEHLPASEPTPFQNVELQHSLRASLLDNLDEKRLERAMRELEQVTHVWPPDLRQFIARKR